MERYFESLEEGRLEALEVAERCREQGEDPSLNVEIPAAEDLADRVESLMDLEGLAEALRGYSEEGLEREEAAFAVAGDIAEGRFGELGDMESVEKAVRTAVAILTEGVVAAPIEGIDRVDEVPGGGVQIFFAGPIRSAGGTAQAVAVLVADYVRQEVGLSEYEARDIEVERAKEEIPLYKKAVNLQYEPKPHEIETIMDNCPVMVTGEPTEDNEVSGKRNLERIPTNRLRGGFALVVAEGLALKAAKLQKYVDSLDIEGWGWLEDIAEKEESDEEEGEEEEPGFEPNDKFLQDLIAGRPVFTYPSEPGGFRLRYGRSRNTGLATAGIPPVTMRVVDDFLATGTQTKTELPGKAAGIAPVDGLEGPTLRLRDGRVVRVDTQEELRALDVPVDRILDLGEILIGFGEFLENNHTLLPGGWCEERWQLEADADEAPDTAEEAIERALEGEPLHPAWTYPWHDLEPEEALELREGLRGGLSLEHKPMLETLLVPHEVEGDALLLSREHREVLEASLPAGEPPAEAETGLEVVRGLSGMEVRPRAPTRVGARMGRPEKSKEREMSPAVHCLFPLGEAGGSTRNVVKAVENTDRDIVKGRERVGKKGQVDVDIPVQRCGCGRETYRRRCPDCGEFLESSDPGENEVDLAKEYRDSLDRLNERSPDTIKGVKGLTSAGKTPEPLEKGILRARHGVSIFKDGTIRYDVTDMPLTHFRPSEVETPVERLRELGYEEDTHGRPLEEDSQVLELYPQDVVVSKDCGEYLLKAADFVDDLLERFYDEEPYYDAEEPEDLVGELLVGLAPHTSAGVLCRLVGFTDAAASFGHPYFHAAKRRNCFHPDEKIWLRDPETGWTHSRIQDVVEARLEDPETDDFGTLVQHLDGDAGIPSVTSEGEPVLRGLEAVSKHPAPNHLLEIQTKAGRTLRVTPDHTLLRWGEEPERILASDLGEGDLVPSPKRLRLDGSRRSLDLLREFVDLGSIPNDDLMIRGVGPDRLKTIVRELAESDTDLEPVARALGVSQKTVHNWVSRDSLPVSALLALGGESALDKVPDRALLSVKRDTVTVERHVDVDEELATLLGYYAAEGFTRHDEGNLYQTTICIPDDFVRRELLETFAEKLGVDAYEENEWKITASSRLIASLFTEVLEAGSTAHEKRIPDTVMGAPEPILEAFLSAYFSGDGSTSKDRVEVRGHTVSTELKEDLVSALKRLGITAKAYRERRTPSTGALAQHHRENGEEPPTYTSWCLKITSSNATTFAERIGFHLPRKARALQTTTGTIETRRQRLMQDGGEVWLDEVESVEIVESDAEHVYCLTVEDTHTLVANDLYVGQCDGDEDCFMLLLDGYVNFSKEFLPETRGGQMDAPLVLTTRIDPEEVDDEAHNVDAGWGYPLELYEAADRYADPKEAEGSIEIAEDLLEEGSGMEGFGYTMDTSEIDMGPPASSYKELGAMEEKALSQLELGRRLRAVDEADVATRVVQSHFLPDLMGNLRAFTSQKFRCVGCNAKYRRIPLRGDCTRCGDSLTMTVHEGSVKKYLEISKELSQKYDLSSYTQQRIELLEREIESIFQNDKFQQKGLAEFM